MYTFPTALLLSAAAVALCLPLAGCKDPPVPKPSVSYKTKAENAHARIEKTYRLSETETIKVVIVPGYPVGERCVIYTNGTSSTMSCSELTVLKQ